MCLQCCCQHGHRYAFLFTFKSNNLNCMNSLKAQEVSFTLPTNSNMLYHRELQKQQCNKSKVFEIVAFMREVMSSDG